MRQTKVKDEITRLLNGMSSKKRGKVKKTEAQLRTADLVDRLRVFFVDYVAFDLEGWGHFAFVDGEFARQQIDAFDAFVV